jgi:hypothetical protein
LQNQAAAAMMAHVGQQAHAALAAQDAHQLAQFGPVRCVDVGLASTMREWFLCSCEWRMCGSGTSAVGRIEGDRGERGACEARGRAERLHSAFNVKERAEERSRRERKGARTKWAPGKQGRC